MARLHPKPYPGNWDYSPSENIDAYLKRTDEMLKAIPNVISFPFADGRAVYHVKSMKPLVLQHIPYGDAWQIPAAHIRGLTARDVEAHINRAKAIAKLFAEK